MLEPPVTRVHEQTVTRLPHGHHEVAASIFVGSLILGASMILSAELMKPERYEFYLGNEMSSYIIYDRTTGRATRAQFDSKDPLSTLSH